MQRREFDSKVLQNRSGNFQIAVTERREHHSQAPRLLGPVSLQLGSSGDGQLEHRRAQVSRIWPVHDQLPREQLVDGPLHLLPFD